MICSRSANCMGASDYMHVESMLCFSCDRSILSCTCTGRFYQPSSLERSSILSNVLQNRDQFPCLMQHVWTVLHTRCLSQPGCMRSRPFRYLCISSTERFLPILIACCMRATLLETRFAVLNPYFHRSSILIGNACHYRLRSGIEIVGGLSI
jgi:hypothetical protein